MSISGELDEPLLGFPLRRQGVSLCLEIHNRLGKLLWCVDVPPDRRGSFGQELDSPQQTDEWRKKLGAMVKELQK